MSTKILLADDSITIQKVVGIIFANEDYELVVVDNGSAALDKAREIHPAVMLVDALMPEKSGYEVCEEVRRDPSLASTPLLLLVGAFEPFDENKARTAGADDFITKPFESQNLIDKVKKLAELAESRDTAGSGLTESCLDEPAGQLEPQVSPAVAPSEAPADAVAASANLEEVGAHAASAPLSADAQAEIPGVIQLSSVDIVEASPDEDLWGAFSEEGDEGEAVHIGEVIEESDTVEFSYEVEEIEPFSPVEDETPVVGAISGETPEADDDTYSITGREERPVFEEAPEPLEESGAVSGTSFTSPLAGESISLGTEPEPASPALEVTSFESPADVEAPAEMTGFDQEGTPLRFASEEEYVPADEAFAALEEPPAAGVAPSIEGERITISEAQLAEAISRISRELIEKIAWDVVPDLAETIIKEEIRKIKEGMSR
jgi:CheY-like chemotaxis protein